MSSRRVRATNPIKLIGIVVIVLAALGGGGYWYWYQQEIQRTAALAANAQATSAAQTATSVAQAATDAAQAATSVAATAVIEATLAAQDAAIERQYQEGVAYQTAGETLQAQEVFRTLIKANPNYKDVVDRLRQVNEALAEAYYQNGLAAYKAEQWAEAVKQFDLALEVLPNYKDTASKRADALRRMNATPTPQPSPTPDPAASPTPEATLVRTDATTTTASASVAFRDTFDTVIREEWRTILTGFSVVEGQLVGSGGFILYKPTHNDYTISAQVKSQEFAIIFRSNNEYGNYKERGYGLYCKEGTCWWRTLYQIRYNSETLANGVSSDALADNQPDTIKVDVQGNVFLAYVNDELLFSIRHNSFTAGSVGLWVNRYSTIDNFQVELHK